MNGAKLAVLVGLQQMSYLQGVEVDTIKGQIINFERIAEPRGYETDLNDPKNENNWRTGLVFSKKDDKALVNIGISQFVNMDYSDKAAKAKKRKIFDLLNEKATGEDVDFSTLAFKVVDMVDVTNAKGEARYARSAYKAYNEAVEKAQKAAEETGEAFSYDTWSPSNSLLSSLRGTEGLEDDVRPLQTLILKGI